MFLVNIKTDFSDIFVISINGSTIDLEQKPPKHFSLLAAWSCGGDDLSVAWVRSYALSCDAGVTYKKLNIPEDSFSVLFWIEVSWKTLAELRVYLKDTKCYRRSN